MNAGTYASLIFATSILVLEAPALRAQQCDDFDACTVNDMCSGGGCIGTPQDSGPCDDLDDCTINDHCLPGHGGCAGDPAPPGMACANGCGSCLSTGGPGSASVCIANADSAGMPCDPGFGACVEGECQVFPGNTSVCLPHVKECPDTDGNPCTDNCNIATGNCEQNAPKCVPQCESCNESTGECVPANIGSACDDSDPCTPESRCEALTVGEGVQHGVCVAGATTPGGTPTATPPNGNATATPVGTVSATVPPGACVGDCNNDHQVAVNELVTGVNIALGSAPISQCSSFDTNGNGMVEVNELIGGVNALLNGCV